jgi:hypothetical protein
VGEIYDITRNTKNGTGSRGTKTTRIKRNSFYPMSCLAFIRPRATISSKCTSGPGTSLNSSCNRSLQSYQAHSSTICSQAIKHDDDKVSSKETAAALWRASCRRSPAGLKAQDGGSPSISQPQAHKEGRQDSRQVMNTGTLSQPSMLTHPK